ncbi:hypothetical protein HZ326_22321 [Fusarium oxysporum f. sp. albedinis]|nr:hypothetical protein HZ326_22321 [Fusarium oxysporum f. sp. albedinis]
MAPSLISLPPEVISMIFSDLLLEDVLRIGLTCRLLNSLAHSLFVRCFYLDTRYIMVEKRDLVNLVTLSTVPRLTTSVQKLNIHSFALSPFEKLPNPQRSPPWAELGASSKFIQSIVPFILLTLAGCKLQVGGLNISTRLLAQNARCVSPSLLPPRLECPPVTNLCCFHLCVDEKFSNRISLDKSLHQIPALSDFTLETYSEISTNRLAGILRNVTIPLLRRFTLVMVGCEEGELEDYLIRHAKTLRELDLARFVPNGDKHRRRIAQSIIENLQVLRLSLDNESWHSENGGDRHDSFNCHQGVWA